MYEPLIKALERMQQSLSEDAKVSALTPLLEKLIADRNVNTNRCNVCHKNYKSTNALLNHKMEFKDKNKCCICRVEFPKADSYNEHVEKYGKQLNCCLECRNSAKESYTDKQFSEHVTRCWFKNGSKTSTAPGSPAA